MFDIQRTITLIKGALFDAEATWRSYLPDAGDWKRTALLITVPLIVVALLVAYVLGLLTSGASVLGLRPTIGVTLLGMVSGILGLALAAFIFSFLAGMFGGRHNFARGFAALSLVAVPVYVGQAFSSLPFIGWLLALGLAIYGLVLLWRIIPIYLEVQGGKRALHYIVSLVVTFVVGMILSVVLGLGQMAGSPDFAGAGIGAGGTEPGVSGGLFGDIAQRAEIVATAEEDRYDPPASGELTEAQVREFARVMQRYGEVMREQESRFAEMSERAEENERPSFSDLAGVLGDVAGLGTMEIELVKTGGGNWAEHQWVRQTLRTAYLQRDINDTVAHNYALYQQFEDELSEHIGR